MMTKEESAIIDKITMMMEEKFRGEGSGHDCHHIYRVLTMARRICEEEKANEFIVSLGALLHDIADHKFHPDDLGKGERDADALMIQFSIEDSIREAVKAIIREISYKGAGVPTPMSSLEGQIVQDADRLDAIGAIGIARAFAYGGSKHRPLWEPDREPEMHQDFDSYRKSEGNTINHFYEKLLLLRDRMNTSTGKRLADERHTFMESWMARFFDEWEGRC